MAANAALANVLMAGFMAGFMASEGLPVSVSIVLALLVSTAIGAVNGYLVAFLELDAFIITLGMFTLLGGAVTWYTNGQIIQGVPDSIGNLSTVRFGVMPVTFIVFIVIAAVIWYMHEQTPFGRRLESIGSNERAARLVGVSVRRHKFMTLLLSGLFSGVAGLLIVINQGSGDPAVGPSYLFPAVTAIFLGATSIRPEELSTQERPLQT